VKARHERLTVVAGDVYDRASLEAAIGRGDVVICMVGPRVDPFREVPPMDLFTTGTRNLIAAMQAKGSRRLLMASSIGVENEFPQVQPDAMKEPGRMWLWNSRWLYKDMRDMEDIVRTSGPDRDAFEEWALSLNIESTGHYTNLTILNDGSDGGPAVLRATGVDVVRDFINPSSTVAGFGFSLPAGRKKLRPFVARA